MVGAVEVRSTLRNVDSVLGDLRRQMAIALGVGALVAGALGFWRARSVARPIHRLTVAARSLASDGFGSAQPDHVLVMPRANDELAELTRAFGDMRGRVQRELERRDAFVADASHELRTPLASIRGAVEILQDGGAERPEVRQRFLGLLQVETDRLLDLVESLLSLETATGHGGTTTEQVDVQNLVDEVVHQLQPLASGQQIQLVAHSTEFSRPCIRGDVKKLRQLLMNLIDNALAHAPTASTVSVTTSVIENAHSCRIDVVDDGPGIAPADRERVFDRFVRLDRARSRNSGGAGLGLAIARTIADAHDATIELLAGANERGTIARIEVPLSAEVHS